MIVNRQRRVHVPVKPLEDFFERVRRELRFPEEAVTVRLISDAAMARLNHIFLHRRAPTDVLSFPANGASPNQNMGRVRSPRLPCLPDRRTDGQVLVYPESRRGARQNRVRAKLGARQNYVGDIAISPESARRNARRFARTFPVEMRILILHGMLHLAGFDHDSDNGEMDRLERRLRRRLGVV